MRPHHDQVGLATHCLLDDPLGDVHAEALNELAKGHILADAVAIIGTLNIVFGDIDR